MNAEAPSRPRPSDGIRALYRALIKLCHPDLAVSDADRLRREEFTARVNAAYAAGDASRLEALASEWQTGTPGASRTPAQASELRVAVEAVRRQLAEVRAEIARLAAAGLGEWLGADDTQDAVRRLTGLVRSELRRQQDALRRLRGAGCDPQRTDAFQEPGMTELSPEEWGSRWPEAAPGRLLKAPVSPGPPHRGQPAR